MIERVLDRLSNVRKRTGGWQARCPAHKDGGPSLSISEGRKGVLMHCHAGCNLTDICTAIGLHPKDLFYENDIADKVDWSAEEFFTGAMLNLLRQPEVTDGDFQRFRQSVVQSGTATKDSIFLLRGPSAGGHWQLCRFSAMQVASEFLQSRDKVVESLKLLLQHGHASDGTSASAESLDSFSEQLKDNVQKQVESLLMPTPKRVRFFESLSDNI